jgi:superfamily II DNA helicase RecQ
VEKPGYVCMRKKAQEVIERLAEENIEALFYHGGLPQGKHPRAQGAK